MGDPDLRSDEIVLVRTPEVFVKSIPFEGILTNKRIVLVDRAKNLLPQKEIPLATIKDIDGGENAMRDPIVTITVITRTGETRQMVFTFTRTAGGNLSAERDEWVKTLKEHVSSSFEQVIRKVIPGPDQPRRKPGSPPSPRIEVTGVPVQPPAVRPLPKKESTPIPPITRFIEDAPSTTPSSQKVSDPLLSGFGTFCSRCGNKVPEGSGFCNRCGSSIIPPPGPVSQPAPHPRADLQLPVDREIRVAEPCIERSPVRVPDVPLRYDTVELPPQKTAQRPFSPMDDNPSEPGAIPRQPAAAAPPQKPVKKGLFSRLFAPKKRSSPPPKPASMPVSSPPPPQKPRRAIRMPGKKVFIAIGVIILLIAIIGAGVVFVYPMISGSESSIPGLPTGIPGVTPAPATTSNPVASGTFVVPVETTAPAAPVTGVYAHISYIGSWKATYGMPAALQTSTDSGDRFLEIENATGPVEVTAEKLDGSTRHELLVEIYKNGGLLSSGKTSAGFGKVTVSADATTGVGQAAKVVSGNVTTTTKPVTNVTTVKTTSASATTVSTVKTTAPVATTKTASP